MKYLLPLLCGFEISDGIITQLLVANGPFVEANPLMAPVVGDGNFLLFKVVGVILCALILLKLYRYFPRVTLLTTSSIVTYYGAVIGWNLSLFLVT
ncbi:MAG TPA: hypothetical protein G4O07_00110 [Dehalococcoidia bacterium]|nr:hypothetical protein [Dehalococcoidia bacterium]